MFPLYIGRRHPSGMYLYLVFYKLAYVPQGICPLAVGVFIGRNISHSPVREKYFWSVYSTKSNRWHIPPSRGVICGIYQTGEVGARPDNYLGIFLPVSFLAYLLYIEPT